MPIHFTTKSAAIFKAPNDPLSAILSSISGNVINCFFFIDFITAFRVIIIIIIIITIIIIIIIISLFPYFMKATNFATLEATHKIDHVHYFIVKY